MAQRTNVAPEGARIAERMNVFAAEPHIIDVMGYKVTNAIAGEKIYQGTPLKTDEKAKTAEICRYAYVVAAATDGKTLTVKAGHTIKAGMKVAISGGDTITALTVATATDELIVLSAKATGIKAGDVLVELNAEGTEVKAKPNRIAASDATDYAVAANGKATAMIAGAHEATVLQDVAHYPAEYLNETLFPGSILLVGCPKIMFIYQSNGKGGNA